MRKLIAVALIAVLTATVFMLLETPRKSSYAYNPNNLFWFDSEAKVDAPSSDRNELNESPAKFLDIL